MELFERETDPGKNWLPYDGTVHYYGPVLAGEMADFYFKRLLASIQWQQDTLVLFGKKIITKRQVAWYGDQPFAYTYSNSTKRAMPWTDELLELKTITEKKSGETFNSCLLNLYHTGEEGMAWHSDAETDLKKDGAIGTISLGAERRFAFRHKQSKEKVELLLQAGSLLVMEGSTQTHWLHSVPPTKKIREPRISLTFRTITGHP